MIICVTGFKRSGKDTVATYLNKMYGCQIVKLAGELKRTIKTLFGWGEEHMEGALKEEIDTDFGVSPRQMLQFFGTEVMQYQVPAAYPRFEEVHGRTFWCKRLWDTLIHNRVTHVIADVRFPHEIEYFKDRETCICIKVLRPGYEGDIHSSETSINNILPDYVLTNSGTLEELYIEIDRIMNDMNTKLMEGMEARLLSWQGN